MKTPALLLALAATAALSAADPIKLGEYASLTGKEAGFGQTSHQGVVLAIEEINAAGGVLGRPLELTTEDNQTKPGESATVVKKLISRDKVVALIGEVSSGRSLEAAPIAQQAKIPMVAPAATNPKVTQTGNYIFRVCFIDPFQGTVMAKFAKQDLKVKRVAILSSVSNAYSLGLAKFFKETFTAGGGEIVTEKNLAEGDKDFRAQLTAVKAAGVDAVYVPCYYTEAALIVRQARDLGLTMPFFGGDGWEDEQLLKIGGEAMNGCFYSTHFSAENTDPVVAAFTAKYKARWNNESPGAFSALGYDAVYVIADAIKRAGGTDGPKLRDALAATKDFPGISGTTTIDKDRNASKSATIIAIKDGKAKFFKTVAP
ncbi:ABC transporter substrate-binding protein [Opitutus sp. GAS368]|uniref:ABC transporter substrate-binding protein n=1 Tax=Opitutus sp. GAS368 TaxID=1882749 RepID=UPI00087D1A55|nr:ABC transporter substrate-binding protein [Opitutus sp. GAS368]SDR80842.1 amino acid/amide ABC transporter substrate-binding protein, HAAT family [Opitutus sp. GAS368]